MRCRPQAAAKVTAATLVLAGASRAEAISLVHFPAAILVGVEFPRFRGHFLKRKESVDMPRTRPAYPAEFRAQIVALARAGRSVEDLAREFEPCAQTIRGWIRSADRARAGGSPFGGRDVGCDSGPRSGPRS